MASSALGGEDRGLVPIRRALLAPLLEDLGLAADALRTLGDPPATAPAGAQPRHALLGIAAGREALPLAPAVLEFAAREASSHGALLLYCLGARGEPELAALRNALWPEWHVGALCQAGQDGSLRRTLQGETRLQQAIGQRGTLLVARRRAQVLAPQTTVIKFDRNAALWSGDPSSPHYRHHRWMRRFVGTYAAPAGARRILDFGCGAGWCGIEAALHARAAGAEPQLCAFDPSPEMVRIAGENARAAGLTRFEGRVGFGEAPPFPAAGEARFDLLISSGVISFSPDQERWCDGLVAALAPGATLVIGDIQRESRGMRRRRARRALLPVRELNARTAAEVRAMLERRGLCFEEGSGYQLSHPLPQLMHFDETRLKGLASAALLLWNRRAAAADRRAGGVRPERFDSWVLRLRAPAERPGAPAARRPGGTV